MLPTLSVLLLAACAQDRVAERRAGTAVMLHRGSADLAVENTLAACEATFLHGADGVEIDIRRTKDGVLVLMHDPWVDRVLDAFGNVSDFTYEELLLYRFRDPYGLTRRDERVPTLREAFKLTRTYSGLLHLDIKIAGADRDILAMLDEMKLFGHVVRVNPFNDAALKADSRIAQLASQGALIHGNNDYDGAAVSAQLKRSRKGTFLVDDPRAAVALLGRPIPAGREPVFNPPLPPCKESADELMATKKLPRRQALARLILHYPAGAERRLLAEATKGGLVDGDVLWALGRLAVRERNVGRKYRALVESMFSAPSAMRSSNDMISAIEAGGITDAFLAPDDPVKLILTGHLPVEFSRSEKESAEAARAIRLRATVARALRARGRKTPRILRGLRIAAAARSFHLDGAWQGLDAAEAIKALAVLDPKGSVPVFKAVVLKVDPALEPITKHEEHPWWLRRTASWWDFRVKTEALIALGKAGTPEAAEALESFLALPKDKAEAIWRELHWDSARALCSGRFAINPDTLEQLLKHPTPAVRRTASVYLLKYFGRDFRPLLEKYVPWAKGWVTE